VPTDQRKTPLASLVSCRHYLCPEPALAKDLSP
jgi:hypothetical protein